MRQFPLRWHEHLARLDGPRARRALAFALMTALAFVAFGGYALRAALSVFRPPHLLVAEAGGEPFMLAASTSDGAFKEILFLATDAQGGTYVFAAAPAGEERVWSRAGALPLPAGAYTIRAQGTREDGGIVFSSNALSFTRNEERARVAETRHPSAEDVAPTPDATLTFTLDDAAPGRMMLRLTAHGDVARVIFAANNQRGEANETTGAPDPNGGWIGTFDLPLAETYALSARAYAPSGELLHSAFATAYVPDGVSSIPVDLRVLSDASSGPATLLARIEGTDAVAAIFDVTGPDGLQTSVTAVSGASGTGAVWTAVFNAEPGSYQASVRLSLLDGRVVRNDHAVAFEIAPAASHTSNAHIELLSPASGSTHARAVPLSARVSGSDAERVVFVVLASDGTETLVIGRFSPQTEYWSSHFEGAPGTYVVRVRAEFPQETQLSDARVFTLSGLSVEAP